jgi:hypothetical protein
MLVSVDVRVTYLDSSQPLLFAADHILRRIVKVLSEGVLAISGR